ncbi:MAG TPA: hypothetical protein PK843_16470 [bacterium]|nr:hypothetical protein [bacterium]
MKKNRQKIFQWLLQVDLLFLSLLLACDTVHLFEPVEPLITPAASADRPMVTVVITQDPVHTWQAMEIHEDGLAVVRGHSRYQEKRARFSAQELRALREQFQQQNFLQLPEQLIDRANSSAAVYEIAFNSGQDSNKVRTNDLVGNASVAQLLSLLDYAAKRVIDDGLEFALESNRTSIVSGRPAVLQLAVSNRGPASIPLSFHGNGIYRFFVQPVDFEESKSLAPSSVVSLLGASRETLPPAATGWIRPGETLRYALPWDGRDASGNRLSGPMMICAELLSVPGGITAPLRVTVE